MGHADWAALISAFVEGRLGADTFKRRFLEAFASAARERRAVSPKVQALYFVVEDYAGDPMGRGHAVSDDADLLAAARAALIELHELAPPEPATPPPTVETATPEPPPRVVVFGVGGGDEARRRIAVFSGAGCVLGVAYVLVGVLQFFAVSAQMESLTGWGPAPSTIAGAVLAFIPIVGSVIAFFGARDVWDWAWPVAAAAFFAFPLAAYLGGWLGLRRKP